MVRNRKLTCFAILMLCGASTAQSVTIRQPAGAPARFDGTLSLLTYNVKGAPWPVAWGRPADLAAIGARLRAMRVAGHNPSVVVLQETFGSDAKAVAGEAGYRYVTDGPAADRRDAMSMRPEDRQYLAGARWWRGEGGIKVFDSGLQILSDYPVLQVRRMAYPDFACAGYDCLANKGALLVTLRLPGAASPVDVVTTHLNSRHSSGVADERSLYAYRRQAELLADFLGKWHDPSRPLIVAGDFNVGTARPRWDALRTQVARWAPDGLADNAMGTVARRQRTLGKPLSTDALAAIRRNTDWQFYTQGTKARLLPQSVSVPFGREAGGGMLSDHIGYTAAFRLTAAS